MSAVNETWPRPHRLNVDEYYRMAEVGVLAVDARVELIEGGIVDMAPIGSRHALAVALLAERLIKALAGAAIVFIQSPIRLSRVSEPQPDLAVVRLPADRYANAHPTAADVLLVIEVSDTTLRFDRDVKAPLYARHGVPELWIVDLNRAELQVFRDPRREGYADRSVLGAGVVEIPAVEIAVDLSGLFL